MPLPPGGYPAPNPYAGPLPTQQLTPPAPPYLPPPAASYGGYGAPPPPPPYLGYGATPGGYTGYGEVVAPAANGLTIAAMICGILGLVFSCVFVIFGIILDVAALVLVRQYNNVRRQNPHAPVHPSEGTYIRIAQITAGIGFVFVALTCLFALAYFGIIIAAIGASTQLTPIP